MKDKTLIVIAGPTAAGKTSLGIAVARHFGTVILSADSRQFYRQTDLGTAKPDARELRQVRHYFVNTLDIEQDYNAGQYETDALKLLEELFKVHRVVVMVGGSGMYIKAVCEGLDNMPETDQSLRDELNRMVKQQGLPVLLEELSAKDPDYYSQVDKQNPQRVVRALEIIRSTGDTYTSFRNSQAPGKVRPFNILKVGLEMPREQLYRRIDQRMDEMIASGLFREAETLYDRRHLNALRTVGYTEIFNFLAGEYDKDEAIRLLKRNSRRYAKRQLTWFKRDGEFTWFSPKDQDQILQWLEDRVS